MLDLGLFGISSKLQHWARQPSSGGGCNSSLVLVGTCRWEFETGPIHIPTFQEKVTHSYTNRPDFGQNFDKVTSPLFFLFIYFFVFQIFLDRIANFGSNFRKNWKIDSFIYKILHRYEVIDILIYQEELPMLVAYPRRVFCTEYNYSTPPWSNIN